MVSACYKIRKFNVSAHKKYTNCGYIFIAMNEIITQHPIVLPWYIPLHRRLTFRSLVGVKINTYNSLKVTQNQGSFYIKCVIVVKGNQCTSIHVLKARVSPSTLLSLYFTHNHYQVYIQFKISPCIHIRFT